MVIIQILQLGVRTVFGMSLLLVLLFIGFLSFTTINEEERLAQCTWVPVARVMLGDTALNIPALKHTRMHFGYRHNTPSGSPRASAVLNEPWDDVPLGFCDADLIGSPEVVDIQLQGAALLPLLAEIGFDEGNEVRLVSLRNRYMTPVEIEVIQGQEDVFALDPGAQPKGAYQPLEKLRTSGWVNGTHAVSSFCMETGSDEGKFYCSYRVLRRADAIEIKFIGVLTDSQPELGQRNPELLDDLLAKFDAVLNHYALTTTQSD